MTEESDTDSTASDRLNGFAQAAVSFVVPLFDEVKGFPDAAGTGLLLRCGQQTLLVSAAHVLDVIVEGTPLHYYSDVTRGRRVTGPIRTTPKPGGKRSNDRLDVGIVFLSDQDPPPYPNIDKDAVPFEAFGSARIPRNSHANLFVGFPSSKSIAKRGTSRGVESTYHSFAIIPATTAEYSEHGLTEANHILLPFDPAKMVDTDGKKIKLPKLNGISGSPVWQLENHDGEGPCIVGIVTSLLKKNGKSYVVATEIGVVADMIRAPPNRVIAETR